MIFTAFNGRCKDSFLTSIVCSGFVATTGLAVVVAGVTETTDISVAKFPFVSSISILSSFEFEASWLLSLVIRLASVHSDDS